MKGVFFTEFVEMIESRFSLRVADAMLEQSALRSGGIYTTVGTYDVDEFQTLLHKACELTGVPVIDMMREFGRCQFNRLIRLYPTAVTPFPTAFDLLEAVDAVIHAQIRRIYPDAELPAFTHRRIAPSVLELEYASTRPFAVYAMGILEGCIDHYGENIRIERVVRDGFTLDDPHRACFRLIK